MGGTNENPTEQDHGGPAGRVFQVHRPDLDEGVVGSLYRSEIFCTSPEQRRVGPPPAGRSAQAGRLTGAVIAGHDGVGG
ncbi:hypothetical protein GCM10009844_19380 [Nocardioides koreensis]|uniref:Uncharacterized protein n=1 Tax=Nocardioides koreensis TaxID=433651 RepID=A0ABN2ZNS3_9ACTN